MHFVCDDMFVTEDTPVLVRDFAYGTIYVNKISTLGKNEKWTYDPIWKTYHANLLDIDVWSHVGWCRAPRIVRRKPEHTISILETNRGIVEIEGTEIPSFRYGLPQLPELASDICYPYPDTFNTVFDAQTEFIRRTSLHVNSCYERYDNKYVIKIKKDQTHNINPPKIVATTKKVQLVYSLQTMEGMFQCGLGELILPCEKICINDKYGTHKNP